jgi:hypothetical protein
LENWRAKALEYLPELKETIREQLGPSALWTEIFSTLEGCYERQPFNDDLIGRIYDFAGWCLIQPQTPDARPTTTLELLEQAASDVPSAAAVGLIESIPLSAAISQDLHRWLSVDSFEGFENLLRYHLSPDQYAKFRSDFLQKKSEFNGPSRL